MPAVAITDTNNVFGSMEFSQAATGSGVQPIIGSQLGLRRVIDEPLKSPITPDPDPLVFLAKDRTGYMNLMDLISRAFMNSENGEAAQINWSDLEELNEGLICLTGGVKGPVGRLLLEEQNEEAHSLMSRLKGIFSDRLYVEIQRHGTVSEENTEEGFLKLAYDLDIPLVATNECYYPKKEMYEAHDALICIAGGNYVMEADRPRLTEEHYFKSSAEMIALFEDLPEAVENTRVIAKRCAICVEGISPLLPQYTKLEGRTSEEALRDLSRDGLIKRLVEEVYPDEATENEKEEIAKPYWDRLEFELGIIAQMGFPGYFLIVADFIQWAKDHDIPVGPGRGSGAGSVVAWALTVTDLDPLRYSLLFERFLNPERVSMPDFDIDFCQDRRDEVITYVQNEYGRDRVAQIITFGKLQAKAVVRDVGRVLQMPYGQVDRISKLIPANPANPVSLPQALESEEALRDERDSDPAVARLLEIGIQLEGLYRHASTHAAGVVIGDRPLHELVALYRDPRS
ncbi:MAG: DNA polymerase III subunit alpha, partial [Alphaproteobacteria bacterium]|nr:DNA polymerase III subunit alpha [Alphaproteobacteria bacterium]